MIQYSKSYISEEQHVVLSLRICTPGSADFRAKFNKD